jgi:PAS domain S-box-containing protein
MLSRTGREAHRDNKWPAPIIAYGFAILATVIVTGLRLFTQWQFGATAPYLAFYYVSIVATAWFAGLGPALLGGALGCLAALGSPRPAGTALAEAVFWMTAIAVAWLIVRQRSTRWRLEREIAERARERAAEQRQQRWLEVTLASIGDGVIAVDEQGRINFMNGVAESLTEWRREEAMGQPLESVLRLVRRADHGLLTTRSGKVISINDSSAPLRAPDQTSLGTVLVFRDITGRRRAEATERQIQERLAIALEAGRMGAWEWDIKRGAIMWSPSLEQIHGLQPGTFGGTFDDFQRDIHPDDRERVLAAIQRAVHEQGDYQVEYRIVKAGGEVGWLEARGRLFVDVYGEPERMTGVCMEVTERKRVEAAVSRLAAIVESSDDAIIGTDLAGVVQTWNRGAERVYGYRADEAIGRPMTLLPPERAIEEAEILRSIASGESIESFETVRIRKDGRQIQVSLTISPIRDANHNVIGASRVARDISERKRVEEQLQQAQKLESLGILAGGIAHDFNNLLTGILGNATLLSEQVAPESDAHARADSVIEAAERAAHLTRQMLAYSGRSRFITEPLDCSRHVREITALVAASIPKNVAVRFELASNVPLIEVDAGQFQQLVMNLVINGGEAIGKKEGTVTISTRAMDVDAKYLAQATFVGDVRPGTYVALEVRDTGCGMDEATIARIFDPFFTTKFTGRGLGLAAALGIVRGHKGAINVESRPGQGTRFQVLFPLAKNQQPLPERATTETEPRGSGIILVVDDEDIVRRTARSALERYGYDVVLAPDGWQGVEMFARLADQVVLVLLDMTMPVMSGEATFRELRKIRPNVRVIASSGYSESEAMARFGQGLAGFIQKPYSPERLAREVEAVTRHSARSEAAQS